VRATVVEESSSQAQVEEFKTAPRPMAKDDTNRSEEAVPNERRDMIGGNHNHRDCEEDVDP
jgi:hypothetical protein